MGGYMGSRKASFMTSAELARAGRVVTAICQKRCISDTQAQKELGWCNERGAIWRLRQGKQISAKKVNDLRIWIRRWAHVLQENTSPTKA